jgi:hypothetical protein
VLYARHEYQLRLVMVEQQTSVILTSRGYAAEGLAAAGRALSLAQRIEVAADVDGHCHLARAGQPDAAAELMHMAVADDAIVPAGYPPAVLECAIEVWQAAGEVERASQALRRALDWVDTASRGLPDELRSSFVERNPVNRRLIELGRRTFATST